METTDKKQLTISSSVAADSVVIRFEDTGVGVLSPADLFKPFQQGADATGLGLYVLVPFYAASMPSCDLNRDLNAVVLRSA
jgi:C4-dicarboxylate-specific signal transduction histidine kinase